MINTENTDSKMLILKTEVKKDRLQIDECSAKRNCTMQGGIR